MSSGLTNYSFLFDGLIGNVLSAFIGVALGVAGTITIQKNQKKRVHKQKLSRSGDGISVQAGRDVTVDLGGKHDEQE